jgi:hypothetical protein
MTSYDLANIALWAFDFHTAADMFNRVIAEATEAGDLLGALGAAENAAVTEELQAERWSILPEKPVARKRRRETAAGTVPLTGSGEQIRKIVERRYETAKNVVAKHKYRIRESDALGETVTARLAQQVHGPWFLGVQELPSITIGRGYRRDGITPNLEHLGAYLRSIKVETAIDKRSVRFQKDGIEYELWFDGRISCLTVRCEPSTLLMKLSAAVDLVDASSRH